MRRLIWDIETSPNIGMFWKSGFKLNIGPDNIIKERAIICIGYKWEGEKESHCLTWDKEQNDKAMLAKFLKVADSADELIAHNGDNFDLPWFKTRCLFHGLQCFPTYKTVDTLQWARRQFYFNSNKLNYIAKFLGIGQKLHTEFGLWEAILLRNCKKSMATMTAYCKQDVILLEKVWARLALAVPAKTHAGVMHGGENWSCPRCQSERITRNKTRVSQHGNVKHWMRCLQCGGFHPISQVAYDRYLEDKEK